MRNIQVLDDHDLIEEYMILTSRVVKHIAVPYQSRPFCVVMKLLSIGDCKHTNPHMKHSETNIFAEIILGACSRLGYGLDVSSSGALMNHLMQSRLLCSSLIEFALVQGHHRAKLVLRRHVDIAKYQHYALTFLSTSFSLAYPTICESLAKALESSLQGRK